MIRILGIDPGSLKHAIVLLEHDNGCVLYRTSEIGDLGMIEGWLHGTYDAAITETINGVAYSLSRSADLIETARNEGRIIEKIHTSLLTPMTCTAAQARGHFCRSAQASDAQIAIAVEALVKDAPTTMRKVDRKHIYDAILYGLFGLHLLGVRLTLPPSAEFAVGKRRYEERARSAAKVKITKVKRVR